LIEVRWTEQATDDLAAIRAFIARDSVAYALSVTERLYSAVGQLREFPDSGRVVPELQRDEIRELIRAPFRIVYRRAPELVEILTVFHAAREFPASLR
jgi:plasmid stabilization system protein ParE